MPAERPACLDQIGLALEGGVEGLVAVGNVSGPGPHCQVLHDRHSTRLYAAIVGEAGTSRKGLAWRAPRHLLKQVALDWMDRCVHSGLNSGESLIAHVRDPLREDKRALVIEAELAAVLKRMSGEGNSLSPALRDAWDDRTLGTTTKNSPRRATGAHMSVVDHITATELDCTSPKRSWRTASAIGGSTSWFAALSA